MPIQKVLLYFFPPKYSIIGVSFPRTGIWWSEFPFYKFEEKKSNFQIYCLGYGEVYQGPVQMNHHPSPQGSAPAARIGKRENETKQQKQVKCLICLHNILTR